MKQEDEMSHSNISSVRIDSIRYTIYIGPSPFGNTVISTSKVG